jgi:hypothetical protein
MKFEKRNFQNLEGPVDSLTRTFQILEVTLASSAQ